MSDVVGHADSEGALSVAVTPLAIPILGGPGTIPTAMNYASTGSLPQMLVTLVAFAALCVITYGFGPREGAGSDDSRPAWIV